MKIDMAQWKNDGYGNLLLVETTEGGEENIICVISTDCWIRSQQPRVDRMTRPLSQHELQQLVNMLL